MGSKTTSYVIMISITAALSGLLFGIDTGVISGALPFVQKEFGMTTFTTELVVSAVLLGAFLGTLIASYLSNHFGRKVVLLIAGSLFAVGSVLSATSHSSDQLIFYRIILGLSVGMAAFTAPIYLSEMAPRHHRGGIVAMYQVMVYTGILVSFISDTLFSYSGAWRWMLGIIAIPAIIMVILVCFLPRSPRWLMMRNYFEDAKEVLKKIREDRKEIAMELEEIRSSITHGQSGWKLLKKAAPFRRVILLGVLIQAMQQFTGINMVFYYASKIYGLAGFQTTVDQMWMTVVMGVVNVIACAASIYFVDKSGRKPLLYLGYVGMSISMLLLAIMFGIGIDSFLTKTVAILAIFGFLITFAISSGPIAWILCAEIFPLKGRDFGMAVATCTNWICNMILALIFLTLLNYFGATATFAGFAVFNFVCLFFVFAWVPETKNISLEHIEQNLFDGKKLRNIGD